MVSLRTLITAGVVAMATPATAMIGHLIRPLTYKTVMLFTPAQSIDLLNGPLIEFGQGPYPEIITGIEDIVKDLDSATEQIIDLSCHLQEGADDPQDVADAYWQFVRIQQVYLQILTGKAGLFTGVVPVIGQPVARVLRDSQRATDALGAKLVSIIDSHYPYQNNQLISDRALLNGWYYSAIASYEGLVGLRKRDGQKEIRAFIA